MSVKRPCRTFHAPDFLKPELVHIKVEGSVDIGHANHCVQIFHEETSNVRQERDGNATQHADRWVCAEGVSTSVEIAPDWRP